MIQVVHVKNPFDPLASREIRKVQAGHSIRELISVFSVHPGYDLAVSVDGLIVTSLDIVPGAGSSVVFCAVPAGGDGKNPLAIVAMLALIVAVPALVQSLPIIMSAGMSAVVSAGMYIAGGMLISAIFPVSTPSIGGTPTDSPSPTYSWEVANNATSEGVCLPELFGTHRVTPPIIGHYIRTDGDKQYLNLLFAVAGHPLDSITSVRVSETLTTDMIGVIFDTRLGAVTQNVIQFFGDTQSDTAVGSKLEEPGTYVNKTTSGNTVEEIIVTLSCPKGLFYAKDNGSLAPVAVKVKIEYSVHDADSWTSISEWNTIVEEVTTDYWSAGFWMGTSEDGTSPPIWTEVDSDLIGSHSEGEVYTGGLGGGSWGSPPMFWHWVVGGTTITKQTTVLNAYVTVSDSKASPLHRAYTTGRIASNKYDIRCSIVEDPLVDGGNGVFYGWGGQSTERLAADVYFESYSEIVTDDFTYPGVSLCSVQALATDKLSGSVPKIDMLATRSTVPVWTGASYTQLPATNPAWACYHLLHQARCKGTGDFTLAASYDVLGVLTSRIDFAAFNSWAGWCDNPAGDFTLAPHTCNIYFDMPMSLRKVLDIVGACGRGSVVQIGTKYTCVVDRPEQTPVQRFLMTPGNIVAGSFQEEFLPMQDRANSVEVAYFDAAQDYTRQTVELYASDYDTTEREINKASVTLYGVTVRQKAIDYARFLLNSARYLTNTVSIEADVDSIACIPGDVIEIVHDVPQWGYGGRVVSATANTITLDRSVTIAGGTTYHVMVKHQDDDAREEKTVTTGAGDYTTLSISGTWTKIPELHALYSFGEVDHVVKEFRVLRIGTGQDLRRKITALEYLVEVFEDGAAIPTPESDSDLPMVASLTAIEVYRGGQETKVYLKWRGFALYWNVFYRRAGSTAWTEYKRVYNPSCDMSGLDYGVLYNFAVSATDDPGDGEMVSITLRGKIDPPGNIETITATQFDYYALVVWTSVDDFDLWGYELRYYSVDPDVPYNPNDYEHRWSGGTLLFKGNARSYIWNYTTAGTYDLEARAVDVFGNVSQVAAHQRITFDLPEVSNPDYSFAGENVILSWDAVPSSFGVDHYAVSYGTAYSSATAVGTTKANTYSIHVDYAGSRIYWIVAVDIAGNEATPMDIHVYVVSPGTPGVITPTVIDNNVLLSWSAPSIGSLPVAYYEVSKGAAYITAEVIGTVNGTFSVVFESTSGDYVYWVAAYDTAGNIGAELRIPAVVNQPPDYVILQNWTDDFSGTKASAYVSDGKLYAPVNITETYSEHFTVNANDTPQEQIDAGYPLWIQPVPNTATYTRVFNYGASINVLTKITVEAPYTQEYGTATIAGTIEVSVDNVTYEAPVSGYTTTASGFQYVRVVLTVTGASNTAILSITRLNVKLDLKEKTIAGNATANDTDSGGTEVSLLDVNSDPIFIDVTSIVITPKGSGVVIPVYDFVDVPYPTHFHVYLFNAAGTRLDGDFSWMVRGV